MPEGNSIPRAYARGTAVGLDRLRAQAENSDSHFDQAKELLSPFGGILSSLVVTGGLLAAVGQWRQTREMQVAADELQAESRRYTQLTDISRLLHSSKQADRNEGSGRLLMTMARSPSVDDQLKVYQMACDALADRVLPARGLIRLGRYERNLVEAFFMALPTVRESQEMHKPAFAAPGKEMEPSINAEGIILAGAKLHGWDLRYMHMSRGDFRDTRFQNSTLGPTNFNGCDMRGAIFIHLLRTDTDFDKLQFQNADLRGAILRTYYLDDAPNLYHNLADLAATIEDMVLLGDTTLPEDKLKALTDRGALYIPWDHPDYAKYYDLTRTPKPPSLDEKPSTAKKLAEKCLTLFRGEER